jgi:carbonic anhydrase
MLNSAVARVARLLCRLYAISSLLHENRPRPWEDFSRAKHILLAGIITHGCSLDLQRGWKRRHIISWNPASGNGGLVWSHHQCIEHEEVQMKSENTFTQHVDFACNCGSCLTENADFEKSADLSRRGFLCSAIAGTAAVLGAATVSSTRPASAQSSLTPEAALKELMDGNERYVGGQLQSLNEDLSILKAKTAEKQEPFAALLSCADSRVPVEFVFDQSIGQLFVVRVAGNVVSPEITASLEYGVAVLGTRILMVLGHSNCGAVKATIEGKAVPGQIGALYAPIWPAVNEAGPNLDAAIDANARIQATLLSQASPIIAGAIKEGNLKVVPARYDIASGKVALLA